MGDHFRVPAAAPKMSRQDGQVLLRVLFVVYLALLAWIVLWKLAVPSIGAAAFLPHPIKLIPFLPSGAADASAPLEVLANVLLFVPFGVYLGLLAPAWKWWKATAVFVGASLVLEITQHLLSIGTFDITDIIVNTAGGMAGLGLVVLARRRFQTRTVAILSRVCLVGTVLSMIAVAIFIASPIRYAQQEDVVVPQSAGPMLISIGV